MKKLCARHTATVRQSGEQHVMKHFKFDIHWDAIKGQLKQKYGQLADDDLAYAEGKGEELLARLRMKLALSQEQLDTTLDELYSRAMTGMEQVKTRLNDLAAEARDKAQAMAGEWKTKASAVGEEARAQASAAYDHARQRARTLREEGEDYVRKNPRESLVAALCAGFVVGWIIWR